MTRRILFAIDGTIAEGTFAIRGYDDGVVAYDTPVGRFRRRAARGGELVPAKEPPRRGRKPRLR